MNKPFDPTKPVQTRDGRKARIICTDRLNKDWPILALVLDPSRHGNFEFCLAAMADGRASSLGDGPNDLINIPQTIKVGGWLNVFSDGSHMYHTDKNHADLWGNRIACVPINLEVREGEGL